MSAARAIASCPAQQLADDKPAAPVMFLMIDGAGFTAGGTTHAPTSPIDITPTILAHLELPGDGMDGRSLQGA